MKTPIRTPAPAHLRQRGLTLVEMTVTILIALFLLAGLFSMVQSTRHTYTNQTQLAQLEDSERMAMTLLTDVIESAGYYPNPAAGALAGSGSWASGQGVFGTAPGGNLDTISVRFATKSGDTILNCLGDTNTSGGTVFYINTFQLTAPDAAGNRSLECILDDGSGTTKTVALVSGVQNMQIYYGVQRNPPADANDTNVDTYLLGSEMTATDWPTVTAVRITLWFNNPLLAASSKAAVKTLQFQRVIAVMGRAGVST
jgi:type IV pilus assembly protein PilW